MHASFGLECPHLHCTRVHNSGLQTPTSSMRKSTTYTCTRQEDTRAMACTRQETRASHLHASKRCVCHSSTRAKKTNTHNSFLRACKDARAASYACVQDTHAPPLVEFAQRWPRQRPRVQRC